MEKILFKENFELIKFLYSNDVHGYSVYLARRCKSDDVLVKFYTRKLTDQEKKDKVEKLNKLSRIENVVESTNLMDIIVDDNGGFLGYSFGFKKSEILSRKKMFFYPTQKKLIMLKSLSETIKHLNRNDAYIYNFSDLEAFSTNGFRVPSMFPSNLDQIQMRGIDFKKDSELMIGINNPAYADSFEFNILAYYLLSMTRYQGFDDAKMNLIYPRRELDGSLYYPVLPKGLDSEKNKRILHQMISKKGLYRGERFEI